MIVNSEKLLKQLKKYGHDSHVKAVVIRIDSPGGVVGASQEYYEAFKRFRAETKKPLIVSCANLTASGAYYAAVGADAIFTNAGTLMGSIGVIMEFANLQGIYDWAKVKRFSIKTGPYKDSGSEYRPMRDDERELFQNMIDQVHLQFKKAVAEGRKLSLEKVSPYADGRIFTGEQAVKLGFADKVGDLDDAVHEAAQRAGISGTPEVFEPTRWRDQFFKVFFEGEEDEYSQFKGVQGTINTLFKPDLLGKPLFLMPGSF